MEKNGKYMDDLKRRFFFFKGGKEAGTVNLLFECIENCVFFHCTNKAKRLNFCQIILCISKDISLKHENGVFLLFFGGPLRFLLFF